MSTLATQSNSTMSPRSIDQTKTSISHSVTCVISVMPINEFFNRMLYKGVYYRLNVFVNC